MHRIRSTTFASWNLCPQKAKLQQEYRYGNKNFSVGNAVHATLCVAPQCINEGRDWVPFFKEQIAKMDSCTPDMVEKALSTVKVGIKSIEQALCEGFEIRTEVEFEKELPSGIVITGHVDRIDTNKKLFRVIDYKIGSFVPTKQDMFGDMQLLVYSFLVQDEATLNQNIEIGLFSLGRDFMQTVEIPIDIEMIIEELLDERAKLMVADTEYAANPSSMCAYCDFKNKCAFWEQWAIDTGNNISFEEKVEKLETLSKMKTAISGVMDQLKDEVVAHMIENRIEEVSINGKSKGFIQTARNNNGKISVSKPYIKV